MEFHVGIFLPLFFAAIGMGFFASLLGVGGGIFMVPLLMLAAYVPTIQQAAGTSIAGVVFTSISSTIAYALRRAIDFRIGLILMPTTIIGAWCGARLTNVINAHWLSIGFGVLLLYPVAMMIQGKQPKEIGLSLHGHIKGIKLYVVGGLIGLIAGTASGMFGIGGGTVMVPALAVFLGLDIVTAAATSLFVMVPSATMGTYQHWVQGNVHPELALPLILGLIIGAQIGPRIGHHIPKRRLRQLFGVVLLYAAINMIVKGLH
ncbi:MAG: sulfite exporter TauE/SafE family protein [Candidatus Bipolaricaulota bacterium]|nr:sulfite exporter TauE/SafE family protein [Candidatus Bipolaricaulota bacterium]